MARAYASVIVDAPAARVWSTLRDFGAISAWHPAVIESTIEQDVDPDVVGCVRSMRLADLTHVREQLTLIDDSRRRLAWRSDKPGFPISRLAATMRVYPVTHGQRSFVEWEARFDAKAGDEEIWEDVLGNGVFAVGLKALARSLAGQGCEGLPGSGRRPLWPDDKVWTSRVIAAPAGAVWALLRDFSGLAAWHPDISELAMAEGAKPDKVSGIREFLFDGEPIREDLLHLDDVEQSLSYRILSSRMPWLDYVSGMRVWPVTETNQSFVVWTGNWTAAPQDDATLIPTLEHEVYQKGLAGLEVHLKSLEPVDPN